MRRVYERQTHSVPFPRCRCPLAADLAFLIAAVDIIRIHIRLDARCRKWQEFRYNVDTRCAGKLLLLLPGRIFHYGLYDSFRRGSKTPMSNIRRELRDRSSINPTRSVVPSRSWNIKDSGWKLTIRIKIALLDIFPVLNWINIKITSSKCFQYLKCIKIESYRIKNIIIFSYFEYMKIII